MSAGTIPAPGTDLGPCTTTRSRGLELTCGHTDCAASRADAATPCGLCGAPIGYETRYYRDDAHGLVHALCLESSYERTKQ